MDITSIHNRFRAKGSVPKLTQLSDVYIETAEMLLANGAGWTDESMVHLEKSFYGAAKMLVEHMHKKQQVDKLNIWFIRVTDINSEETLPVGIYICIPDDFAAIQKLSASVNNIFYSISQEFSDVFVVKAAVTKGVNDRRINYLRTLHDSVVLCGQYIVTDIDYCDNINDARELEKMLLCFVNMDTRSAVHERLANSSMSSESQKYWKERFKSLKLLDAYNLLIKVRKALYITGEK